MAKAKRGLFSRLFMLLLLVLAFVVGWSRFRMRVEYFSQPETLPRVMRNGSHTLNAIGEQFHAAKEADAAISSGERHGNESRSTRENRNEGNQ